ncbi:MAG TPA: hypothetical protein DD423_06745 [Opitutae bacterium]|nr:hypothetical protein [Opitutae bacterium]
MVQILVFVAWLLPSRSSKAGTQRRQQCWIFAHAAFSRSKPLRYFCSGRMPSVWCVRVFYLLKNADSR